jgi:ribosomal-protein-alanine N-acetyltransferase
LTPRVRPAVAADVDAIVAIERASFSDPWSLRSFHDSMAHDFVRISVVETDAGIAGYSVVWMAGDECELANLAVDPARRGGGLGRLMLDALLARAHEESAQVIFLEVRASNEAAKQLYASRGFHEVGRRVLYYKNPDEDALVLRRDLG